MDRNETQPGDRSQGQLRARWQAIGQTLSQISVVALLREMRSVLRGCGTVLDIGCGEASPVRFLSNRHLVGLDGYGPALERARKLQTHDEYVLGDVNKLGEIFPDRRFDACVALDVIEHLHKTDGWRLLETMERLATRRVVVFTPNGFVPQHSQAGDLQEHLSGWTPADLRSRGYRVRGMYGPKSLRGEYHRLKYRPRAFWLIVSLLAHFLYTRRYPEKAAAIFCVKDLAS